MGLFYQSRYWLTNMGKALYFYCGEYSDGSDLQEPKILRLESNSLAEVSGAWRKTMTSILELEEAVWRIWIYSNHCLFDDD